MCGINGKIISPNYKKNVTEKELDEMNAKVSHRGPDDQGVFVDSNSKIGIGQTRLSILDLSSKGHQPMEDDTTNPPSVLTFNGEIYNFQEIRKTLQKEGYSFFSNTDSEVLLKAYLHYGDNCLQLLNGMFAFVIFDQKNNKLFGARDRFGQKPLKYYYDENQFIFSSEIKAILQQGVEYDVDYQAIYDFLSLQYIPAPRTGFKNIWKLEPGNYFVFNISAHELSIYRYYDVDFNKTISNKNYNWEKEIKNQLESSIQKRLISDVPLGAFLSGGIDSSAVVAFSSKYKSHLKTFSISFRESDFDESKHARKVAQQYNTDHKEFTISSSELPQYIKTLTSQFDEPFADPSQFPTFILSKLTKNYVTVALSGDGGDENFGGYKKYQKHLLFNHLSICLSFLKPIKPLLPQGLKRDIELKNLSPARRHYNFTSYFTESQKNSILNQAFLYHVDTTSNIFEEKIKNKTFKTSLDSIYYLDLNYYMSQDINTKVDTSSMSHALEVRAPMLDFNFVNMAARIPTSKKTTIFETKKILKKTLKSFLPKSILYRKKKGFGIPLESWFRKDLYEYAKNMILYKDGFVNQIMDITQVELLLTNHYYGKENNAKKIWILLILNIWYENYFNTDSAQNKNDSIK